MPAGCGAAFYAAVFIGARLVSGQVTIMDLGTLGGSSSNATGINDSGQVVGAAYTAGNVTNDPFLWTPGGTNGVASNPQMQDLSAPANGVGYSNYFGQANAINDAGQVAGTDGGPADQTAFLWTPGGTNGPSSNPQFQFLGTFGGPNSDATALNVQGHVVGTAAYNGGFQEEEHGYLWIAGSNNGPANNPQMQDIGVISPGGIDDNDEIVGNEVETVGSVTTSHAIMYQNGAVTDLGTLGGTYDNTASAVNNSGLIVGASQNSTGAVDAFLWSPGGTSGVTGNPQMQDLGNLGFGGSAANAINAAGDIVGNLGAAEAAFLYTPAGGMVNLNSLLPANSGWHLFTATGINNQGQIVGEALTPSGQADAYLLTDPSLVVTTPAPTLVWYNLPTAHGDGTTWDIGNNTNWNSSAGIVAYTEGANVIFDDSTPNTQPVTLNTVVHPGSVTFNTSSNNYTIQGTGSIAGSGSLTLTATNAGSVTLETSNSYTGGTNVAGGVITFAAPLALPLYSSLTVGQFALVLTGYNAGGVKNDLFCSSLTLAGSPGNWSCLIDLANNDMVVQNGDLATITNQVAMGFNSGIAAWQGYGGITSTAAAFDSSHLTALGVIQDSVDGTPTGTALYSTFDDEPVTDTDVLVKYTYYGDANLDGKVDASDYSRIDNGYLSDGALTGWFNGDFNYDGVINGSDYTLIDNAYNMQGAQMNSQVAASTEQFAVPAAVPEPAVGALIGIAAISQLRRRRIP